MREDTMAKLRIARDVLVQTKLRSNLTPRESAAVARLLEGSGGKGGLVVDPAELPLAFLYALLDHPRLLPNQRAIVAMQVYGMGGGNVDRDRIYETSVANPVAFGSTFLTLGAKSPNCELFINGRWYPVVLGVQFFREQEAYKKCVMLHGVLSLCELSYGIDRLVTPDLFLVDCGEPQERTVLDVVSSLRHPRVANICR
jgi:hypothetical protein